MENPGARPSGRRWYPLLALLHVLVLVGIRLWTDADDFNNWDLTGFLNANVFRGLGELLGRPDVHFANPFTFPIYNTGTESVLSLLVHRAMTGVSLYWSNTAVLAVHDLVFFASVAALYRRVFADDDVRAAAWMLFAMSPVLLTFPSTLAFDMQGFGTIAVGLLGCELVLAHRRLAGVTLLALAFVSISQAYPLSFYLPLFCAVWTGARWMMLACASPLDPGFVRRVATVAAALGAGVLVCEAASGGDYVAKVIGVVAVPLEVHGRSWNPDSGNFRRVVDLMRAAFLPMATRGGVAPPFGPFGILATAAVLLAIAATRVHAMKVDARAALKMLGTTAAWLALVLFGYLPALFGVNPKSQRCFFGDLFLAMAVAALAGWLLKNAALAEMRVATTRMRLALLLVVALLASDARYLATVLAVDHRVNHAPVFDYDPADGVVRHDLQAMLVRMREQVEKEGAALIVHYPRGRAENSTDPAVFHARMLRFFGPWSHRDDVIFTCRFCNPHYGCPFREVARQSCRKQCCYRDPVATVLRRPGVQGRTVYFWWHTDDVVPRDPTLPVALKGFGETYDVQGPEAPGGDARWSVYRLTPKR